MSTSKQAPNIKSLAISEPDIVVDLDDGQTLTVPLRRFARFTDATPRQLRSWRLIGGGDGVHWDELDEDISVRALLRLAGEPSNLSSPNGEVRPGVPPHKLVRDALVSIIEDRESLVGLACRSRSKFERWLQFELADKLRRAHSPRVLLEAPLGNQRTDITFFLGSSRYDVELKTPNTSWRVPGVVQATRPITDNLHGIVSDAAKLQSGSGTGLVAFVLFPLPNGDKRWLSYLARIALATQIPLSEAEHCTTVSIDIEGGLSCDAVVCVFPVQPE